ncbi:MAG: sigma-70 family RNA polymerase sigma factor [Planctomycetes bacterium]|nr:sigma-70 family RNA polymerase sigma factor [Planctomycetota bacterium]
MFLTTMWSQLADAGAREPTAIEALVARYRAPLLTFVRRRGQSREDSEDVVQEVFLRLFANDLLSKADRERGRFRSYLLGITTNVLRQRSRRAQAAKRGGELSQVSLSAIKHDPIDPKSSSAEFDECWVAHLVARALEAVEAQSARQHELLVRVSDGATPGEIAEAQGLTPGQVRVDLHRARKRLARQIREEVARYCSSEEEFEQELGSILGHT